MKTFKTIIAWLDWSSYCGDSYTRPKTLCPLFWRTFFTIITLPVTYLTHVVNVFVSEGWRNGYNYSPKLNMGIATLLHLAIIAVGVGFLKETIDKELGWDWIRIADPIWITYPKVFIAGVLVLIGFILALGAIIGSCYGVWYIGKLIYDKYRDNKPEPVDGVEPEPSLITIAYKSIKDKYCPIIDWSDIEKS